MKKLFLVSLLLVALGTSVLAAPAAKKVKIKPKVEVVVTPQVQSVPALQEPVKVPPGHVYINVPAQPAPNVNVNVNVPAQQGGMTAKEMYALMNRKSYRLGLRAGIMSPTDTITVTKDSTFNFGFDFDAKLNENFDCGPRISYISQKYNNGSSINDTYGVLVFGFGGRMYLMYWGEYGSTHGFFNMYICGDGNYCAASKSSSVLATSPSSFAGFTANGGVGLELAFGPNATGFVDVRYQKSSVKDSAGTKFPLDGFMVNIGSRMAFF